MSESMLERLSKIQRMNEKYVFVLLIIGVVIPTLIPIGLPVAISEPTRKVFNYISNLPKGSIVIFADDIGFVTMPECYGAMIAVMRHMFTLDIKIIFTTLGTVGSDITVMAMNLLYGGPKQVPGKVYGKDYIIMPYVPGADVWIAAMAQDFQKAFTVDYWGVPLTQLPLFSEVKNGYDVDLIMEFCHGPQFYNYIRFFNAAYGTKIAISVVAYIYAEVMPYYTTGQFIGYMVGLRGAGEYEKLVGRPGIALAGADALSGTYAWILVVIIIGNAATWANKLRRGGKS